jgi:hypothetical protein
VFAGGTTTHGRLPVNALVEDLKGVDLIVLAQPPMVRAFTTLAASAAHAPAISSPELAELSARKLPQPARAGA